MTDVDVEKALARMFRRIDEIKNVSGKTGRDFGLLSGMREMQRILSDALAESRPPADRCYYCGGPAEDCAKGCIH
jgi:hypothetical protein